MHGSTAWTGARDYHYNIAADTAMIKGSAELKVGSTVTVTYVMSATKVEGGAVS